jgi:hypothetical protein
LADTAKTFDKTIDHPNTLAPEGAQRCRALASGLKGPVGGSKRSVFPMNGAG